MDLDAITISLPRARRAALGKRAFDLIFSSLVLIGGLPIFLLISLAIKLSGPGKVFFVQDRVGQGGKVFKCLKFRTMHENAEAMLQELLKDEKVAQEWKENQKLRCDPRVFSVGNFLRKTSLDELPQFWNVLKGDLSVVGPRPYILSQLATLGSYKYKILSVKPGLTGLWQTSGRSSTTFVERISLDANYVDRQHFLLDIRLIAKTIPVIIFSKDAC